MSRSRRGRAAAARRVRDVGRVEGLDRELGDGDVGRGLERGRDREQRQLAAPWRSRNGSTTLSAGTRSHRGHPGSRASSSCKAASLASPVCSDRRRTWPSRCARHWARLTMRGASPSGCRLSRSTFTGGSSRCRRSRPVSAADRGVGVDQFPPAVDHQRRVGLVRGQHERSASRTRASSGASSACCG